MRVNSINCFCSQNSYNAENKKDNNRNMIAPSFKGELLNKTSNTISKGLIYTLGLVWIGVGLVYEVGKELFGFNKI